MVDQWDEHYAWLDDETAVRRIEAFVREGRLRDDFLPMCRRHRAQGKAFYETIFWAHLLLSNGLCIVPSRNMINNLGATAGSTHFGSQLETLPRGYRRIFTMKRYEMDERPLHHPRYVVEHVDYRRRVYRIMAFGHPWVKVGRSIEELWLNLRHGNFSFICQSIRNRIHKWMGRKTYY